MQKLILVGIGLAAGMIIGTAGSAGAYAVSQEAVDVVQALRDIAGSMERQAAATERLAQNDLARFLVERGDCSNWEVLRIGGAGVVKCDLPEVQ